MLLALDTAGPNCAVALARDGDGAHLLAARQERIGRGHAERLPVMVADVLAEAGVAYADLDRVAVTTGPGSFTGVRIGIAFARGLGLALDVPVVGVGSLHALMRPLTGVREGTAIAALDAKRGEVFVLARDLGAGADLIEAEALSIDELARRLDQVRDPIVATGAGAPLLAAQLGEARVDIVAEAEAPDIADVAALAMDDGAARPPKPLYARAPDAKPQRGKTVARV